MSNYLMGYSGIQKLNKLTCLRSSCVQVVIFFSIEYGIEIKISERNGKKDVPYMYGGANGNGKAVLRMHHVQIPHRRMPDHRIFQWLHRQLCETCSFYVTRQDDSRRRAVRSPNLEESILNVVPDRPE
ncbi:hypothetical protein TNCV_1330861 [Trichonephila clavipes]|uniref:Uncharacterized protein n=1 Tax=Trichonephila clavipes TaxID=2585209 RepID=A0A8X6UZG3_TRICX|nr:hypothetical protein TNCV_1330861 [Trichonephila clavipes]